jgi:hypothetical protein
LDKIRLVEVERVEKERVALKVKLVRSMQLNARLLDHISSEATYTSELRLELWKAKGIIKRG